MPHALTYEDPLRIVEQLRTTPLTELVGFLATRSDIGYARIRFAGADMMISA